MKTYKYILLLHKHLTGEIAPPEQEALDQWLKADPENRKYAQKISTLWKLTGEMYEQERAVEEAFHRQGRDRLMNSIHDTLQPQKNIHSPYLGIAATWTIALVLLTAAIRFFTAVTAIHATDKQVVLLTDSAHIVLNRNTVLRMKLLSHPLTAELRGQAYFSLKGMHMATVYWESGRLTANGATFFVTTGPDYGEVIVTSGSIQLTVQGKTTTLTANQQALYTTGAQPVVSSVQNVNHVSWYSGVWQFKRNTLTEILGTIRAEYETDFQIQEASLQQAAFTGTFVNEDLESMLQQLSRTLGFSYTLHNGMCRIQAIQKNG